MTNETCNTNRRQCPEVGDFARPTCSPVSENGGILANYSRATNKPANSTVSHIGPDTEPATLGPALLRVEEAAEYLRVSKNYLDKLRVSGGGPAFVRLGRRKVIYRIEDLNSWVATRVYGSTTEYTD